MQINVTYYSSEITPPTGFQTAINYITNYFDSLTTKKITVNIEVGYGRYDGGFTVARGGGEETDYSRSGTTNATFVSYSTVRAALLAQPLSAADQIAVNALPVSDPLGSGNDIYVQPGEARALGLAAGTANGSIDAYVGFGLPPSGSSYTFDPNNRAVSGEADFIGIALHKFSHALGRVSQVGGGAGYSILDLFRWAAPGVREVQNGVQSYFSIDGGQTALKNFATSSDQGDWDNGTANNINRSAYVPDSGNAFYYSGYENDFTSVDTTSLDVIGYNFQAPPSDTTPPVLVADSTLSIMAGSTGTITAALLRFDDNVSTHLQETYTIVAAPTDGVLLRNGSATSSFTQADIDNGLITYRETAGNVSSDSFIFTVTDAAGNPTGSQQFFFQISNPMPPSPSHVAPTVNVHNVVVAAGEALPAASLIASISNPSGDQITAYEFVDGGTGGGYFTVNGTSQPANQRIEVSVDNLGSVQYVGGPAFGSEALYVGVYDRTTNSYSNYSSLVATTTVPTSAIVTGIGGAVLNIPMDTPSNIALLQPLLTNISNGVAAGTVLPSSPASPPAIPAGKSGMLQIDGSAQVTIPAGYASAIVDATSPVTITGGSGDGQLVAAGQGGLTFIAGTGAGTVFAGGGNNSAFVGASSGSQFIALGNGADTINVMGGNNTISGGTGSNLIFLGAGQNCVRTGGADTLVGGTGSAAVTASGAGTLAFGSFASSATVFNAVLTGNQATISSAISVTSVTTSGANAVVFGSFGAAPGALNAMATGNADTVYAGYYGAAVTLAGSNGLLYGNFNNTPGALRIVDSGSGDTISAANSSLTATLAGSQALLFGGYGNIAGELNILDVGRNDTIATGNSDTTIRGGFSGSDLLVYGGNGALDFVGGSSTATVLAGTGPSTVSGGAGGTTLFGSAGSNVGLTGRQGLLYAAGGGNETLNGAGSSGNNELVGGSGSNLIVGGSGSDTLFAGAGAETLGGGGGSDAFAFVSSLTRGSAVVVLDFTSSDAVYLSGYGSNGATTALNGASSSNGNTTITLADHTQITFLNVGSANTLQGHVFAF